MSLRRWSTNNGYILASYDDLLVPNKSGNDGKVLGLSSGSLAWVSTGLSTSLTNAHIFVGNGSNVATDVAVSGDLTLANTGAFTIANDAVTTAKILNANVTLGKIANASANSVLLGSGASGSGSSYSEISLGTGLSMTGTTLSVTGSSLWTTSLVDFNSYYTVIDDDVVNTTISVTTKPGSPTYTKTILSGNIPSNTYIQDYFVVFTIGGFNNHATLARTVNWRLTLNGTDIGAGDNSQSVTAQKYWYIAGVSSTAALVANDVIGVKLWGSTAVDLDYRYVTIYIFPRYINAGAGGMGLFWSANPGMTISGAVSGVTYVSGVNFPCNLYDVTANVFLTFPNTVGNITPFFGSNSRPVTTGTSGSAPTNNNSYTNSGASNNPSLFQMTTALRYVRVLSCT